MQTPYQPDSELITWMKDIRRWLHRHPELGFNEHQTAGKICQKLDELGVMYQAGIAGTGVVATIGDGEEGEPCIALRADMDALAIHEKTGLPFTSENPGLMHACGHDGHVAMLLGAAALLKKNPPAGKVVLIFQPAEEAEGGAQKMIQAGVLDGVQAIFAGHIDRHFKVGEIVAHPGLICAYTDTFTVELRGRGGHAAKPHETVDSIVVASLLVMAIQTLVSREVNPAHPSVITVGQIMGGTASNVIAERAELQGTIRTTLPEIRDQILLGMSRMVGAMEELYDVETSVFIEPGYPPVINDEDAVVTARKAAKEVVDSKGIHGLTHPSLGGEDFSFFLEKVPGCMVRFGAMKPDLGNVPAHSPFFDFDEDVLEVGAAFLAHVADMALKRSASRKGWKKK